MIAIDLAKQRGDQAKAASLRLDAMGLICDLFDPLQITRGTGRLSVSYRPLVARVITGAPLARRQKTVQMKKDEK